VLQVKLVVMAVAAMTAVPAGSWELTSASYGFVEAIAGGTLGHTWIVVRSKNQAPDGLLALDGTAENILVHEYEESRQMIGPQPYTVQPAGLPMRERVLSFDRARISMHENPRTAWALEAEGVRLEGPTPSIFIHQTLSDPAVRGGTSGGLPAVQDEPAGRTAKGYFLDSEVVRLSGHVTGDVFLYWLNQTVHLDAGGQQVVLESRVWDDRIGGVINRHILWYELRASRTSLSVQVTPGGAPSAVFLSQLEVQASRVSLAAGAGTVANQSVPTDASVWLEGQLHVAAAPQDADTSKFKLSVSGQLRQFSFAGAPEPFQILPQLALSGGLLLAAAIAFASFTARHAFGAAVISFYTKLRKEKLLNVPARETIFRAIQQAPGIHFVELQKQVGSLNGTGNLIGFGALAYHLSQMERFELIVSKREGRFRRYFDRGANLGADAARVALLQTSPVTLVAREVLASPGLSQAELHTRVSPPYPMTRQALSYHLRRLSSKELVEVEERGRFCHYRPTERLSRLAGFLGPSPTAGS
jgi:predicted transcriptional regulator